MPSDFESIFIRLRTILQNNIGALTVVDDQPGRYCLALTTHVRPGIKGPMPVAWVQISKAYVSFHFMPVYACPKLLDGCSEKLKARMQGKSCFNFKVEDENLFKELEGLTARGFAAFKQGAFDGLKPSAC